MLEKMKTKIMKMIAARWGIAVMAETGGWLAVHHVLTMAEALEWMACYPAHDTIVVVSNRNGKELARRMGIKA